MEQDHPAEVTASPEPVAKSTQTTPRGLARCRGRSRSGSRCRRHALANGYCPQHASRLTPSAGEDRDLSEFFSCPTNEFDSAGQINDFLSTVAELVVKNEISARRAAVLAYITNQLLRTLPIIQQENPPQFIFDLPRPRPEPAPTAKPEPSVELDRQHSRSDAKPPEPAEARHDSANTNSQNPSPPPAPANLCSSCRLSSSELHYGPHGAQTFISP